MYKNLIFDFGQVIVRFDPFYMTSRYIEDKDDINLVQEVVFDRLYWDRLDNGTITDDEVKAEICKRLPERLHINALSIYENWYKNIPPIDGMENLIKSLKAEGKGIYLLSNISTGFAENYHNNPEVARILSLFDGLVFSGELKTVKPDRDIFEYILKKYNLNPAETFFIDDNEKNILGAKSVGISGYLFDGNTEKLKKAIK